MTTPTSIGNKYHPMYYPAFPGVFALPNQNLLPPPQTQHFLPFPNQLNQLSYPAYLPPQPYFMPPQNYPYGMQRPMLPLAAPPKAQLVTTHELAPPPPLQNQKKSNHHQTEIVDLVSDEECPAQPEKVSEEKNLTGTSKPNQYNQAAQERITVNQQLKETNEGKIKTQVKTGAKVRNPEKTVRKYETFRHKALKKVIRKPLQIESLNPAKKGEICSQRLIQRQTIQSQPFKISKKQKQQFQISFLREFTTEILTGPQFQSKLPKFKHSQTDKESWLKTIREDLLLRQYCEEEEESDDE